jgi:hypothetical protein
MRQLRSHAEELPSPLQPRSSNHLPERTDDNDAGTQKRAEGVHAQREDRIGHVTASIAAIRSWVNQSADGAPG